MLLSHPLPFKHSAEKKSENWGEKMSKIKTSRQIFAVEEEKEIRHVKYTTSHI